MADEHRLLRSSYLDSKLAPNPAEEWICDHTQQVLAKAISQLNQYFQGKRGQFTVPLEIHGTEFQQKVYNLVREVPVGATASYAELAAKLKMPRAARSIGAAISKNPLLIFIPDHRVINRLRRRLRREVESQAGVTRIRKAIGGLNGEICRRLTLNSSVA